MTAAAHETIASAQITCPGCGQPIRPGEPAWAARRPGDGSGFRLALDVETRPPPRGPTWHCRCLGGDR
jgi:hypothetical protein